MGYFTYNVKILFIWTGSELLIKRTEFCNFLITSQNIKTHEPHHKKSCFLHIRTADQHLCFPCIDSIILLLPKSEISSL